MCDRRRRSTGCSATRPGSGCCGCSSSERLNVTELTGILGLAQSGVSRHLKLLEGSGFVVEEKRRRLHLLPPGRRGEGRAGGAVGRARGAVRAGGRRPGGQGRRRAAAGGAAAAQGELRATRARQPRRPAARARAELGRLVARARPAAAAAAGRRPRLRRGLSDDRGLALGRERDRASTDRRRCSTRARALGRRRRAANVVWRRGELENAADRRRRRSTWRCCRRRCTTRPIRRGAVAEAARIAVPGGRVLVLDLREHQEAGCARSSATARSASATSSSRHAARDAGLEEPRTRSRLAQGGRSVRRAHRRRQQAAAAPRRRGRSRRKRIDDDDIVRDSELSDRVAARRTAGHPLAGDPRAAHRHHRRRDGHDHPHLRDDGSGHPRRALQGLEEGPAEQRRPLLADAAGDDLRHPSPLPRSRRGHHRDQYLRRHQHHARASSSSTIRASTAAARIRRSTRRSSTIRSSTSSPGRSTSSRRGSAANGPTASPTPPARPRFVAGAIGPLTVSLSNSPDADDSGFRVVTFDQVKAAYIAAGARADRRRLGPAAGRDDLRLAQRQGGARRHPGSVRRRTAWSCRS